MPFQASKLDLLKTSSSSPSISSLLFEHSSNSLAISLSDSSHLLFPSFSLYSTSPPPTAVPPASTAVSFLRLLPISRVLFFAVSPLNAGAALILRAWILDLNPPCFASVRLTYKKREPATLPLAHGFGVRLIGTVNYFVVHAPAASQIWVMAAKIEEGEDNKIVSVDLVKCAVVDCDLPIYSIGMSMGIMVLGEIGGVRVFSVRMLVKGVEFKGKRKGHLAAGKSGDRLFDRGKRIVPNGVVSPDRRPDGGVSARTEGITEESNDRNQAPGKLRCVRLRQNSGDLGSFFIKIKCNNVISESDTGALASVKAISIHLLSQKQFLILDSVGDLHLLTLHGTFTASEVRADSSSKYAHVYCLDVKIKVQLLAVPPDISARPEFVCISDGAYSVHMMSMANIESSEKDGEKEDKKEKYTLLSAAQVIFTSEKVQHIIALSAKAILVLGQGQILRCLILTFSPQMETYLRIQYLERVKIVALSFQQMVCNYLIEIWCWFSLKMSITALHLIPFDGQATFQSARMLFSDKPEVIRATLFFTSS